MLTLLCQEPPPSLRLEPFILQKLLRRWPLRRATEAPRQQRTRFLNVAVAHLLVDVRQGTETLLEYVGHAQAQIAEIAYE